MTVTTTSPEATGELAVTLAQFALPGHVVVLAGGLGAGKTTFVRAYARALGVTVPVTSPSYTLVHHYRCGPGAPIELLVHADLWRLASASELGDLALGEALIDGAAAVIEWGDRFDATSGSDRVVVSFEVVDDTTRRLEVSLDDSSLTDAVLEALAT
ncbi:MAG TPA: tRNA (adenosine(37)-N6)-threonylcarbamoyltransferase complex ATPase subunit type 1 TsaE [Acidimicrobiales bacterium]|jgi:tRNA threonylcarbamoyladenosine biosynthesis protein TsaE|nr:tRNA (adenosine(37)-N6)-threonylcarbamoyltransferase complex ATPase subunit type 1 TsaE [Acidimicrobiales bacterium]